MEKLSKETPMTNPSQFVSHASEALRSIENLLTKAPSDRSRLTAEFVIKRLIDLFTAASKKSSELQKFQDLINKFMPTVNKAFGDGLTKYRSLIKVRSGVDREIAKAISKIEST